MFKTLVNIFRVPELRNKVLFTIFMLAIYRIGYHVPLPGVDQSSFEELNKQEKGDSKDDSSNRLANYVSLFSGGNLSQSTIFGLGVMPYISASIIFQLLGTVVPSIEKMQKEGETGRKKIQEWTRYATVPLAIIQGIMWMNYMYHPGGSGSSLVQTAYGTTNTMAFWLVGLIALTAGCVFLMWLGEQVDEYGLGNGVSLIILAGIVARMPAAFAQMYDGSAALQQLHYTIASLLSKPFVAMHVMTAPLPPHLKTGDTLDTITPGKILFLAASFVFVVGGSILITQAQRRIPIQQAKHTRGRRIYGGSKQYLPLRVNHGGVMPIIFAQSLMLFPSVFLSWLLRLLNEHNVNNWFKSTVQFLNVELSRGAFVYVLLEVIMIYFFAYFWTTVQFQPKEMADQLKDYGSFVPGLRPGKRTADYLEKVMMRITYVGAAFLSIIAIVPTVLAVWMSIPFQITAFLGGTGLLIVVSVALDMVQRIEANLLMRNYGGFLGGDGKKGKRIKGRQY